MSTTADAARVQDQVFQAALEYSKRGFSVIPVSAATKKPLIPWKEYQRRRPTDAEIHAWFQQYPDAQIAVVTGAISGVAVIDVEAGGSVDQFPQTAMSRTGGGGYHLWYAHPGHPVPNAVKIKPLVDIRGDGGYVIVPPSLHPSGSRYQWVVPLDSQPLAAFPAHLFAIGQERVWPKALGDVPEGARNETLAAFTGRILHDLDESLWESVAWPAVRDRIKHWNYPNAHPFTEAEARGVFDSIAQRERAKRSSPAATETAAFPWPDPLDPIAFYGLAGDFVRLVGPHSEADPAALLSQFIVAVGNLIGRGPYFQVEATRHHMNLFAAMVGTTSRSRKGTALGHVRNPLACVDAVWASERVRPGLSSGEGLIWAVRDPIVVQKPVKVKGRYTGEHEEVVEDYGVDDKRLLVIEEELASALQVMKREGNTLSPTMRCAWDTGMLESLTKNSPARATDAHISVVGHITRDELLRHFDRTEAANGFGNRFLWLCVKRSKVLPEGGYIREEDLAPLIVKLAEVVKAAKAAKEIIRDEEAREIWRSVYPELTRDTPGLLGAVVSRAEAQVTRLSCLYALLDESVVVKAVHLKAALALWGFAEQSARFIFGDSLGYPEADAILRALRATPQGLTLTQIQDLFQRNKTAEQIHRALEFLVKNQFVRWVSEPTGGRPAERWQAIEAGTKETKETK